MGRKNFRRARRKPMYADPMPTINPKTNHLENENNAALKQAKQSKKPNINRISKKYNIPTSTLQDRISGHVMHGTKPGP